MRLRFFTIPVFGGTDAAEELNRFLATERVEALDRQLVQAGPTSAWTVCVTYESTAGRPRGDSPAAKRGKVDYREVLNEQDFPLYAELRGLRKELAEAEGVPLYNLFTNEQMAEMVTRRVTSAADLRQIPGVGEARVDKYGAAFLCAGYQAPAW